MPDLSFQLQVHNIFIAKLGRLLIQMLILCELWPKSCILRLY